MTGDKIRNLSRENTLMASTKKQHKQSRSAETADELSTLMEEAIEREAELAEKQIPQSLPEPPLEVTLASLVNKYSTRAGLLYTSARYRRKMSHEEALIYVTQKEEAQDR